MLKFLKGGYGAVAVLFLMGPQIVILPLAFNSSGLLNYPLSGFSLRWFAELLQEESWRRAIMNSLIIGAASAALATVLGTLAAIGLRRRHDWFYGLFRITFVLPMVAPVVVVGIGMQLVFPRLGLNSSYAGVIIGHAVISVPFVVLSVAAALGGIEANLERAAASLGADRARILFMITCPLAMPGIVTGAAFAFATSLDEVVLTLFLAGPKQRTVAREMFGQMRDNLTPAIAAVAFVFIVATLCIAPLLIVLRNRRKRLALA